MIYQVMPPLSEGDYEALKADIAERGLMVPIEVDEDGNILDGHHRERICKELGVHCQRFVRVGLDEAGKMTHARRLNIARRHLNQEQKRALIADELKSDAARSNRQIAGALAVDHKTVASARDELEAGGEIPHHETRKGKDGVAQPAKKPARPKSYKLIDDTPQGVKALKDRVKEVRADEQKTKRKDRDAKLIDLSNNNSPLPQDRLYPVIYADPPWEYDFSPSSGRAVENHYPTMPIDDICALPVADLATEDAVLFLWAPPSFIKKGILTLEAWGFELASSMVWDKEKIGTGIYFRQQHEYLLLGKRGKPITPAPGTQPRSVFREARGKHSAKPLGFYDIIEQMYPGLPKIELFSRAPHAGWAAWGNQADAA